MVNYTHIQFESDYSARIREALRKLPNISKPNDARLARTPARTVPVLVSGE